MEITNFADLGAYIREAREASGASLDDIAGRIKISARILSAIDNGNQKGLPHAVYTRAFVRSYAAAVGINVEEISSALDIIFTEEELGNIHQELGTIAREKAMNPHNTLMTAAIIAIIALLLSGIGCGTWFIVSNYGTDIWDFVKKPFSASSDVQISHALSSTSSTPESSANRTTDASGTNQTAGDALSDATHSAQSAPENSGAVTAGQGTTGNGEGSTSTSPTSQPAPVTPVAQSSENSSATVPSGMHSVVIEANATEKCWVDYSADGARVQGFMLESGQKNAFSFKKTLRITFGNAGGVKMQYDGKPYDIGGKTGQTKTINLSATN